MIQSPVFSRAKACGRLLAAGVAAILLAAIGDAAHAQTWDRAHGDGANTNFLDVVTAPAKKAPITVPGLGKFAHGTGPVIARDGTVYLGTAGGKLIALRPDGSPLWSRDLPGRPAIVASPCLSANGTIYVVGVRHIRDNRVDPPVERSSSTLYIYAANGVLEAQIPFPEVQGSERGVAADAAPNIWRSGGTDVVMVPARYRSRYGNSVRLIAFSASGRVLANQLVKHRPASVSAGTGGILPDYNPPDPRVFAPAPRLSNVGVHVSPSVPFVHVSDQVKDHVVYTFNGQAFVEALRTAEKDYFLRTPPMSLPNGRTLIALQSIERNRLGAETPSLDSRIKSIGVPSFQTGSLDIVYAAPTLLPNGAVLVVGTRGQITALRDAQVVKQFQAPGGSIVSAAASRTHVFVSTQDAFLTYDPTSMAELARIDWVGGGVNQPAIGPQGHVYVMASNILFVFPPPNQPAVGGTVAQPLDQTIDTNPNPPPAPDAKTFKDPMTANGNRLFACEELDQDDCGKGDYQTIATAFCKKQGFIGAGKVDVDSKKVKAETLDGRFCSKKKCKVFEQISCANN
jgi:hypothetical protein